ncbi:MAG: galactokinase [Planctomycetales bacterium]|nr:galactokinase [Planctomycetales bacterium]
MASNPASSNAPLLAATQQQAERHYLQAFGQPAQWCVAAPGRVNLIGEHTDYNDGFVLPMAIERYVVIAAGPGKVGHPPAATIRSVDLQESFTVPLNQPPQPGNVAWSSYLAGVIAGFLDRGEALPAFNAVVHSSVPLGGGLSSSAALEVATATLLESILATSLDPSAKALLCQQAEHRFANVPCGIMDQFSSVFGQADVLMLLDCRSRHLQPIPFTSPAVTVLIVNSNVRHELTGGEYAARRRQCEAAAQALGSASLRDTTATMLAASSRQMDEVAYRRARHVLTENERTLQAAEAIRMQDWPTAGKLMYASHASLRDDFEVSCDELDCLVAIAEQIGIAGGVFGARMTGGGFGGCVVSLVNTDAVAAITETIYTHYTAQTGIEPTTFATRPARGSHVLR